MNILKRFLNLLRFEDYKENKERINYENRTGITLILIFYSVILILNLISTFVSGQSAIRNRNLMMELVFMLVMIPLYFLVLKKKKHVNFTLLIYLIEIPMLLIPIWHGTFEDPENLTFTFLLFLLILPELILDKPWRVDLFVIVMTVLYIVMDMYAKTPALFIRDSLHAVNTCLMSMAVSLYVLVVRIQNNMYINIVERKADRDPLTGLYNRYGAERHFRSNEPGLLLYMDLDQFKEVNDSFGHEEGDRILQETADVLKSCFRKNDILIRMGGDEFAVFAFGEWTSEEASRKLTEVQRKVDGIHTIGNTKHIDMTVSIGCVYAPEGASDIDELIRSADQEMYDVKRNGKDNFKAVRFEKSHAVNSAA